MRPNIQERQRSDFRSSRAIAAILARETVRNLQPLTLGALQRTEIEKYRKIAVSAGIKPE